MKSFLPQNVITSVRLRRRRRQEPYMTLIDGDHFVDAKEFHDSNEDDDECSDTEEDSLFTLFHFGKKRRQHYVYISRFRRLCGRIVNDKRVSMLIVGLIITNAILMGVQTFDEVQENENMSAAFEKVDYAFLIAFTVELCLHFVHLGIWLFYDPWLMFDLLVVLSSWLFNQGTILRSFRIFRTIRLVARVGVLRQIVSALLIVLPRMLAIIFLLCIIIYIFSVMFTSLFSDLYENYGASYNYFTNLEESGFTLFQIMTLDNWSEICSECQQKYIWAWFPFFVFVILTSFITVNLMVAVICDAVSEQHAQERKAKKEEKQKQKELKQKKKERKKLLKQKAKRNLFADENDDSFNDNNPPNNSSFEKNGSTHGQPDVEPPSLKDQIKEMESQIEEIARHQEQTKNMMQFLSRIIVQNGLKCRSCGACQSLTISTSSTSKKPT